METDYFGVAFFGTIFLILVVGLGAIGYSGYNYLVSMNSCMETRPRYECYQILNGQNSNLNLKVEDVGGN